MSLRRTLRQLSYQDAARWDTGLSPEGARKALEVAIEPLHAFPRLSVRAPKRLLIWCAGNVFTAPLEWVAWFRHLGSEVVLKAPMARPRPTVELGAAFGCRVVVLPHATAFHLLDECDALLAFGGDPAMAELDRRAAHLPRSLHGHRVSFAVLRDSDLETARGIALDAALYDGAGCMSPAAVFHLGDAEAFAANLAQAMEERQFELPRGPVDEGIGPAWRRRLGQARMHGRLWQGRDWAVPLLPPRHAEHSVLPRMVPVHPIDSLDDLAPLAELPLSTLGTDLPRVNLPFHRVCRPGEMQRPPLRRVHDGVDVIATLCQETP